VNGQEARSAAQGHSEQPPGPGWPPVMTDEEAKAKLREKVKARRERDAARTPERKRLFWKQIEQARKDVEAWPDYLKRAFGVKP
jgi:hypothetical protein